MTDLLTDLFIVITGNFIVILGMLIALALVAVIFRSIVAIKTGGHKVRMAEIMFDRERLGLVSRRIMLNDLRNSAIMLTDTERGKLDTIKEDNSILSRKKIALMNEAEERLKRLELGSDVSKIFGTMNEIKKKEEKLLGEG